MPDHTGRSFDPSGYVRENAVHALAGRHDGGELMFLLLRLNDWVPQVRHAARDAVLERINAKYIAKFAANVPLLERLRYARRADHASLLAAIDARLASAAARPAMLDAMAHAPGKSKRAYFRILCMSPDSDVIAAGLAADDAMVRLEAACVAPRELLETLTNDVSPAVRRAALIRLASRPFLERALLDRNASLREIARFLLRDSGIDFAEVYRNALDTVAGIAGLGETGNATDAPRVAALLSHEKPGIRRAAIRSLIRLGGAGFAGMIEPLLADPSPAVSAAARDPLRRHPPEASELWRLYAMTRHEHVRRNAVSLFNALPKWQSIHNLVRAATRGDELARAGPATPGTSATTTARPRPRLARSTSSPPRSTSPATRSASARSGRSASRWSRFVSFRSSPSSRSRPSPSSRSRPSPSSPDRPTTSPPARRPA